MPVKNPGKLVPSSTAARWEETFKRISNLIGDLGARYPFRTETTGLVMKYDDLKYHPRRPVLGDMTWGDWAHLITRNNRFMM